MKINVEKIQMIQNLTVGPLLILSGYNSIAIHSILGGLTIFFGLFLIVFSIYYKNSNNPYFPLEIVFIAVEGLALLLAAYMFFIDGKKYLPYIILIAAVGCCVAVAIKIKKKNSRNDDF